MKACRLRIYGRVQGVGYRAWAQTQAAALGLDGFVRNRQDGSVELLAVGAIEAVDLLITACRSGPPAAHVTQVDIEPAQGITPTGFSCKPTV